MHTRKLRISRNSSRENRDDCFSKDAEITLSTEREDNILETSLKGIGDDCSIWNL